jgi:hypothetical protein
MTYAPYPMYPKDISERVVTEDSGKKKEGE